MVSGPAEQYDVVPVTAGWSTTCHTVMWDPSSGTRITGWTVTVAPKRWNTLPREARPSACSLPFNEQQITMFLRRHLGWSNLLSLLVCLAAWFVLLLAWSLLVLYSCLKWFIMIVLLSDVGSCLEGSRTERRDINVLTSKIKCNYLWARELNREKFGLGFCSGSSVFGWAQTLWNWFWSGFDAFQAE